MSAILQPHEVDPRCTAEVDLISRVMRPFLFRVTVRGEPPHPYIRQYVIAADTDNSAALKGLELFCQEFGRRLPGIGSVVPKAKLA